MTNEMSGEKEHFTCPFHDVLVKIESGDRVGCPECIDFYESRTREHAEAMTGEERAGEVRRILEAPMTCSMGVFWPWVDHLVGRGVYTHEFAMPEALYNEARNRIHPDADGIVARAQALIGPGKPVIVVEGGSDGS